MLLDVLATWVFIEISCVATNLLILSKRPFSGLLSKLTGSFSTVFTISKPPKSGMLSSWSNFSMIIVNWLFMHGSSFTQSTVAVFAQAERHNTPKNTAKHIFILTGMTRWWSILFQTLLINELYRMNTPLFNWIKRSTRKEATEYQCGLLH